MRIPVKRTAALLMCLMLLLQLLPSSLAEGSASMKGADDVYQVVLAVGDRQDLYLVSSGSSLDLPVPQAPENQHFIGWYDGEKPVSVPLYPDSDLTLTARFEPDGHHLTVSDGGHSTAYTDLYINAPFWYALWPELVPVTAFLPTDGTEPGDQLHANETQTQLEAYIFDPAASVATVTMVFRGVENAYLYAINSWGEIETDLGLVSDGDILTLSLEKVQGYCLAVDKAEPVRQQITLTPAADMEAAFSGLLPENASVTMTKTSGTDESLFCFDISIDDGWQPAQGEEITVTLTSPLIGGALSDGKTVRVLHTLGDGTVETIAPGASGDTITFTVSSFSVFDVQASLELVDRVVYVSENAPEAKPMLMKSTRAAAVVSDAAEIRLEGMMPAGLEASAVETSPVIEGADVLCAADITLTNGGNEVEPRNWEGTVQVVMTSAKIAEAVAENGIIRVAHIADDGTRTWLDEDAVRISEDGTVSFAADEFSVYAVVNTITVRYLSKNGTLYEVTVEYDQRAMIPEESTLLITEFAEDSEEYERALKALIADKLARGEKFDAERLGFAALDISIIGPDGNELEPAAPVKVTIVIKALPGVADLSAVGKGIEVQHHIAVDGGVVLETVYTGGTDAAFELEPDAEYAGDGQTVDPESVNLEEYLPQTVSLKDLREEIYELYEQKFLKTEFETDVFSVFSLTWQEGGTTGNTSTQLRWRSQGMFGMNNRVYVTVHYVDLDGNAITRPASIGNNTDYTLSGGNWITVDLEDTLALDISGYTYRYAATEIDGDLYYVDQMGANRANGGINYYQKLYQGGIVEEGSSGWNIDAGDIYLFYEADGGSSGPHADIHYGYMENGSFVEFADGIPEFTPTFTNGYNFLVYDVEGYTYDSTYLNGTSNEITPLLSTYNGRKRYYDGGWHNVSDGDDIYVVYKEKQTPTTGGTPSADDDQTWPEGSDAPQFSKSSVNNGDGTNTISLSIRAAEKTVETRPKVNVIVVFDVSGSMEEDMSGSTRLAVAQNAVNTLAYTLLNSNEYDAKMALVSFSTTASTVQGFTGTYNTFRSAVNGLDAEGGTNWEQALSVANRMAVDADAVTFIVFVTDGDPTFRESRGAVADGSLDMWTGTTYQYYRANTVFGEGNDDSSGRNFDYAAAEVSSIAASNKTFYAIGVSNDVTKVQTLCTQAGVSADHAFLAADSDALKEAFASIASAIESTLGFGNVQITDGVTSLTNMEMKVMQEVDPESFTYYRYGGENNKYGIDYANKTEWTTREADGCAAATYDSATGSVQWNMGSTFQLEDGVTYVVTFRAWPSQDAYDLVAELNNGTKTYASLSAAEKAQIAPTATTPGRYALKTNTDSVSATYNKTTSTGDTVTVSDDPDITAKYTEGTIESMELESIRMTVRKLFEDDLTAGEDRVTEVILELQRREGTDGTDTSDADFTKYSDITLNEANNWAYSFYVAPGLKSAGEILEKGYDFRVVEWNTEYHYDLIQEIINPLIVDGEDVYVGDGLVDGTVQTVYQDQGVSAINRVKSGIDIHKTAYDTDGETVIYPDVEFTITGKLLDADGNGFTFDPSWDDRTDKSTGTNASAIWQQHQNDTGAYHRYDKDGNRIEYKMHVADTSDISITLKPGEFIRFINVPQGCTFEFTESASMPDSYEQKSAEGRTEHRVSAGGEFTTEGDVQPTVDGMTVSASVVGNKQYSAVFNNQRTVPPVGVELVKVDKTNTATKLNDAVFALYADSACTEQITTDADGADIQRLTTGNREDSDGPDGWVSLGRLMPGTYYLKEISAPSGYREQAAVITLTVAYDTGTNQHTVTVNGDTVVAGTLARDSATGIWSFQVSNEPDTVTVNLEKLVTGNMADLQKEFDFSIAVKDAEDRGLAFKVGDTEYDGTASGLKLKDSGTLVLTLPLGAVTAITEDPDGYELTSAAGAANGTLDAASYTYTFTVTSSDKDRTVTFTNNLQQDIDTGVSLDAVPYLALGLVSLAGLALLMLRRRRAS